MQTGCSKSIQVDGSTHTDAVHSVKHAAVILHGQHKDIEQQLSILQSHQETMRCLERMCQRMNCQGFTCTFLGNRHLKKLDHCHLPTCFAHSAFAAVDIARRLVGRAVLLVAAKVWKAGCDLRQARGHGVISLGALTICGAKRPCIAGLRYL